METRRIQSVAPRDEEHAAELRELYPEGITGNMCRDRAWRPVGSKRPTDTYICTRPAGHGGLRHVAHIVGSGQVVGTWFDDQHRVLSGGRDN